MGLKVIVRGLWDRLAGWILVGLGALALLIGWVGVSGTAFASEQIPYVVSGGLVGLALIGTGATLLISGDLRDEWRKLDDIEAAINRLADRPVDPVELIAEPHPEAKVNGRSARPARSPRSAPLHAEP